DLLEPRDAGARGVRRRDRGRPVLEPSRRRREVDVLHVEGEGIAHRPPAERGRLRGRDAIAAGIEERHPRTAHEPLERSADEEVRAGSIEVKWNGSDGLVRVDDERGALAMADLREPRDILDVA